MATTPCHICGKQRGKRLCPSKDAYICASCCASFRGKEIECREDCPHLRQSRRYSAKRIEPVRDSELARRGRLVRELGEPAVRLLFELEQRIGRLHHTFSDLTDEEVREGTDLLRNTYETLDKGIIYDFSSPSPRVQALIRTLKELLDEREKALNIAGNRVFPLSTIVTVLGEISNSVASLRDKGKGANPYLNFVHSTAMPNSTV